MTVLEDRLAEYLHVRRQLGFKLEQDGDLLADFVAFLQEGGAERVTLELSVRWARQPGASGRWQMARLSMVRGFARYLATLDPGTAPYVYCEREISELIAAAAALTPALRGATYRTVIGTMATSGTRIGETLALDRDDVDLKQGVLHIRDGKGRRHRDVPVHDTATDVLRGYARLRDRACPRPGTPAFFISATGTPITGRRFHKTFRELIAHVDPPPGHEHTHRRPHDLRHLVDAGVMRPV